MSADKPHLFKPGNEHAFPPGVSGRPGGRPQKPAWLASAAENAAEWVDLVVRGLDSEAGKKALRAALEAAWLAGRNNDYGVPSVEKDVEALFAEWAPAIMAARVSDKADLVRLRGALDLMDRHYGKAQQAVEITGGDEGGLLLAILRERAALAEKPVDGKVLVPKKAEETT